MRTIHQWTDVSATIAIEGLDRPLRILHITDSHVGLIDDRDAAQMAACQPIRERFNSLRKDAQGRAIDTVQSFDEVMSYAAMLGPDLLALTGDLISFPSLANVECAAAGIARVGAATLSTCGNHDWHFPETPYGSLSRKKGWSRLEPLHLGRPACDAMDIGNVRFIAIDNSGYQITDEQLEFAQTNLATGGPTVMLIHLPISIPTLRAAALDQLDAPVLMGDPEHRNPHSGRCWGPPLDPPMTIDDFAQVMAFVRLLAAAPSLVAVLCGHLHFAHADPLSPWAVQYVGPPGYEARHRLIELRPFE